MERFNSPGKLPAMAFEFGDVHGGQVGDAPERSMAEWFLTQAHLHDQRTGPDRNLIHAKQASEYTFAIAATAATISKLETTHEF